MAFGFFRRNQKIVIVIMVVLMVASGLCVVGVVFCRLRAVVFFRPHAVGAVGLR